MAKLGRKSRADLEKELKELRGSSNDSSHLATASRRNHDRFSEIDKEMNDALSKIDWERRKECEADIIKFTNTYCVGSLLDDKPPPHCQEILKQMLDACLANTPYLILTGRGSGKTSFSEIIILYLIATGRKKYGVLISNSAASSQNILNDIFRFITNESAFTNDYPELCLPFLLCNGSYRRKQTYNGKLLNISSTSGRIIFGRLEDKDGKPFPTSESLITTAGIGSGLRGLKRNGLRPDLILIDDASDEEISSSTERTQKLYNLIQKSVLGLGGKKSISCIMTATPISPDDICSVLKNDKGWSVKTFPSILSFPDEWNKKAHGLWGEYFNKYNEEIAMDKNHSSSLQFYTKHQQELEKGADVINPSRFNPDDGTISGIQFFLLKWNQIGENNFLSEYQMTPKSVQIELKITPKDVLKNISDFEEDEIPDGCQLTTCSIDLNTSYGATMLSASFKTDSTCYIVKHKIFKLGIDQKLPDVQYDQQLFSKLCDIVRTIKSLNIPLDCIVVDGGGRNFNAVVSFAKQCQFKFSIPCCALLGRSSTSFNPLVKSRLRNAVSRTVLCGDESERTRKGQGKKWLLFDSDFYREQAQKSFLLESGSIGSTNLYQGDHTDFAIQVTNEKLLWKKQKEYGIEYHWKSFEPHDYLDTLSMARAIAENQNIFSSASLMTSDNQSRKQLLIQALSRKRKIKIV